MPHAKHHSIYMYVFMCIYMGLHVFALLVSPKQLSQYEAVPWLFDGFSTHTQEV